VKGYEVGDDLDQTSFTLWFSTNARDEAAVEA